MNNCFWYGIFACDGEYCGSCKKHLDVNGDSGVFYSDLYNEDVENAIQPVKEKYKKVFQILYSDKNPIDLEGEI